MVNWLYIFFTHQLSQTLSKTVTFINSTDEECLYWMKALVKWPQLVDGYRCLNGTIPELRCWMQFRTNRVNIECICTNGPYIFMFDIVLVSHIVIIRPLIMLEPLQFLLHCLRRQLWLRTAAWLRHFHYLYLLRLSCKYKHSYGRPCRVCLVRS